MNEDVRGCVIVLARTAEVITPLIRSRVDGLPSEIRHLAGLHFGWSSDDRRAAEGTGKSKMVRPTLALLACEAVGGAPGAAHAAAVAVELVHNASLLHDDIIDHSPLRRGRRALWTAKGVPAAILAGDALFFAAVQTLAEASDAGHTLPVLLSCVQVLIQGEYLDTLLEAGTDVSEDRAVAVAAAKTGELLACACALGALAGGADPQRTGHLRAFGQHLGIAFQCADDLLSIWGDERMTGKPDQSDLRSRKISVPVAAAMATNTPQAREAESIDAGAGAWWTHGHHTEDATLLHRTAAIRSGIYLARCLPDCDPDRVETMARWAYTGFAFDDLYCDHGPLSTDPASFLPLAARTAAAIETMDTAVADGNRLIMALQDITRRQATYATSAQLARWTHAQHLWLTGAAEQIAYRARSLTPSPDAYLITRLKSAAADSAWAGMEISLGADLAERSSPTVRALTSLAGLVTAIDNDLFSSAAEAEADPDSRDPSIVDVLARAHTPPLNPRQALAAGIALRDRALVRFLHLRRQSANHYGRDLNRYLDTLTQTIRANIDFSLDMLSTRYTAKGLHTPDDRTTLFTDSPTDDSPTPPPIPSIAWLWNNDLPR